MSSHPSEFKLTRGRKIAGMRINSLNREALLRGCSPRLLQQVAFAGSQAEILANAQDLAREELARRRQDS